MYNTWLRVDTKICDAQTLSLIHISSGSSGYTDVITIKGNAIEEHWDGGARRTSSLGDYVWNDKNKDGLQDSDESPVEHVRVYLQRKDPVSYTHLDVYKRQIRWMPHQFYSRLKQAK